MSKNKNQQTFWQALIQLADNRIIHSLFLICSASSIIAICAVWTSNLAITELSARDWLNRPIEVARAAEIREKILAKKLLINMSPRRQKKREKTGLIIVKNIIIYEKRK